MEADTATSRPLPNLVSRTLMTAWSQSRSLQSSRRASPTLSPVTASSTIKLASVSARKANGVETRAARTTAATSSSQNR